MQTKMIMMWRPISRFTTAWVLMQLEVEWIHKLINDKAGDDNQTHGCRQGDPLCGLELCVEHNQRSRHGHNRY